MNIAPYEICAAAPRLPASKPSGTRRRPHLNLGIVLAAGLAALSLSGCAFFSASYRPEPQVLTQAEALEGQGRLIYGKGYYAVLPPQDAALSPAGKKEAIMFYPGGKVEPLAYLPVWELVSRSGYAVYVPSMPLDLAVLDANAADRLRKDLPAYEVWHLAGHSLGGAMAAGHIKKGDKDYRSLILLGSYAPDGTDLSKLDLAVLSVREEFGLEGSGEKSESLRKNLPPDHVYKKLAGGNHAQFGSYGIQKGDGAATISADEQRQTTAAWIVEFLSGLK